MSRRGLFHVPEVFYLILRQGSASESVTHFHPASNLLAISVQASADAGSMHEEHALRAVCHDAGTRTSKLPQACLSFRRAWRMPKQHL